MKKEPFAEILNDGELAPLIHAFPERVSSGAKGSYKGPCVAPLHIISPPFQPEADEVSKIDLSMVIPVYNEADNLRPLYAELSQVLEGLGGRWEIIFINDGSNDGSEVVLKELALNDLNVKVIHFRRNYGQTAAMAAGFELAQGEVVVTLDADLQNDPRDIPRLLEKMAEGYDLVSGWRANRQDHALSRRLPSKIANRIIAKLTNVRLHDYGCTLKAYKRGVIKNIRLYGEMHRFIPALANFLGIAVTEIPVNHRPRIHGSTKYGLARTYRVILDLINVRFLMDYFTRPIQFFGKLALSAFALSIFILILAGGLKWGTGMEIGMSWLLLAEFITIMTGIQLIMMGLVGEIVIRTHLESRDRPIYIIREMSNVNGQVNPGQK